MNIAIISNTSFNIYNFRLGLILYLEKCGHRVIYISPPDEYNVKIKKATKAQFFPLQHMSRKGYNPFSDFKLMLEIRKIYKQENIDVSLTYTIKPNIYGALATILLKTKNISNITGLGYVFLKNSFANTLAKSLFKLGLRAASYAVFQNTSDQNLVIEQNLVAPHKTKIILGSGINIEKYQPSSSSDVHEKFTFLFVGRLLFDKGIREFIDAAKLISDKYATVQFHLVGAMDLGNPSAVSETQLNEWLLNNTSLHFFNHQQNVIPFIEQSDAVVLPSYREGMPRVILEAMAMKKLFITSDAPGCIDITEDGKNGFVVKVGSSQHLFEQMNLILSLSLEERNKMGLYGRKLVEDKYDEKIIVEEYLKLILSLS